ncbi:TPA: KilA-N domain-containing protein [Salmonella enterica subsp. enterica serovar Havana]
MNTLTKNDVPVICGVEISTDAEGRFNLNALHKASGEGKHKSPSEWLRLKQTTELITELESNLLKNNQDGNSRLAHKAVNAVHGGSNPGSFAHELLAVEYAGWISPSFRLQVNQTFLDYRRGKLTPVIEVQPEAQPQPQAHPHVVHIDNGIVQIARVIAEATASATMKAMAEVITLPSYPTETAAPVYARQPEGEYVPVSKAAWETGLSDSACRKLIGFFKVPVRSNGGLRGLLVNLPGMKKAAERLLRESTAPKGKRKRWSHPQFGNFTCYADLI